jgi:hypothetical protein
MTVAAPMQAGSQCQVSIGYFPDRSDIYPKSPPPNSYWFVAINRYTLKADYNVVQTSNDAKPQGIDPFDTTDYMLVAATYGVNTDNLPQGPLYEFLVDNGAGRELRRLEQISNALSCGSLSNMAYALVGVLGPGPSALPGIEASSILQANNAGAILTSTLIATQVGARVIYSPTMQ